MTITVGKNGKGYLMNAARARENCNDDGGCDDDGNKGEYCDLGHGDGRGQRRQTLNWRHKRRRSGAGKNSGSDKALQSQAAARTKASTPPWQKMYANGPNESIEEKTLLFKPQ